MWCARYSKTVRHNTVWYERELRNRKRIISPSFFTFINRAPFSHFPQSNRNRRHPHTRRAARDMESGSTTRGECVLSDGLSPVPTSRPLRSLSLPGTSSTLSPRSGKGSGVAKEKGRRPSLVRHADQLAIYVCARGQYDNYFDSPLLPLPSPSPFLTPTFNQTSMLPFIRVEVSTQTLADVRY